MISYRDENSCEVSPIVWCSLYMRFGWRCGERWERPHECELRSFRTGDGCEEAIGVVGDERESQTANQGGDEIRQEVLRNV